MHVTSVTIRRRGKKIALKINDSSIVLKGYGKKIRQIAIKGHGKIKPALIITNDFELKAEEAVRKHTRRWLIEKSISEQIDFFHLNRVSSSIVIKVDFDLTMTILAHNLYRLFAMELDRYSHLSDLSIYEKFIMNGGEVEVCDNEVKAKLKKKKNLPLILSATQQFSSQKYSWLGDKTMSFTGMSIS